MARLQAPDTPACVQFRLCSSFGPVFLVKLQQEGIEGTCQSIDPHGGQPPEASALLGCPGSGSGSSWPQVPWGPTFWTGWW